MRRWVSNAVLIAAICLVSSDLPAQGRAGPSRADLALYAGGAWTTPWLETGEGTTFGIGFNPIVGTSGHIWIARRVGVRAHAAYMRSGLPEPSRTQAFGADGPAEGQFDGRIHNWIYDLSLAFRPWAAVGRSDALSTLYLFAGAGGFTANVEGGDGAECVPGYEAGGVCLPYDWQDATVAQFTTGLGLMLIPLTRTLGLFAEAGVHVYASPFNEVAQPLCPDPPCKAERRTAMTTRLAGGVAYALGVPPPPPPSAPPPPPPAPAPPPDEPIVLCVVVEDIPQYVEALVRPQQRDTVVVGPQGIRRPLRAVYPARSPTASGRDWFIRDESIFFDGREYVRFGVPRELEAPEIRRVGEFLGVPLFAPPGAASPPPTLYVPVQDGCIFQPYQLQDRVRRVRG